jgi:1,4-dihydroxy-2-naphthoyl-CoA synthase
VLSGAGAKAFSAGADIKEMAAIENPQEAKALITRLHRSCDAIRNLPVPVIARIHGFCFGAGPEIAAACDVRLASDTASFGMPEVKIGIPSVIEAALFPLLTGSGRAHEILLLGETNLLGERSAGVGIGRACRAGDKPRPGGRGLDRQALDLSAARGAAAKAPDPTMGGPAAFRRHRCRD